MIIVHVIESLSEKFGGPVSNLKNLVEYQSTTHEVSVFSTNHDYPKGFITRRNISFPSKCYVRIYKTLFNNKLKLSFSFAYGLYKYLKLNNPAILHIHGIYRFTTVIAVLIGKLTQCKIILRPCGSLSAYYRNRSNSSLFFKKIYEYLFLNFILNNSHTIHFTAPMEHEDFIEQKFKCNDYFILPNIIKKFNIPNNFNIESFKKENSIPNNKNILLTYSRLTVTKDISFLIDIFNKLSRNDTILIIIGNFDDPNYQLQIKNKINSSLLKENIYLFEHLSKLDLDKYLIISDIFLYASIYDNFCNSVAEAITAGSLVISSKNIGVTSYFRNNLSILLSDKKINNYINLINKVLNDQKYKKDIIKNSISESEKKLNPNKICKDLIHIYTNLINTS